MMELEGPQMKMDKQGYMHASGCARPRTRTHTHARTYKYLIFIAVPRQQWFRERASLLCYTYTVST